jgi:hypothetical protein
MKQLIIFLTILVPNLVLSQINGGIHLYLSVNSINQQTTIIYFDQSSTDSADNCCDAIDFGGGAEIYTMIGNQDYIINSYSSLSDDKWIPLGVRWSYPVEFEIGIFETLGQPISCLLYDSFENQIYQLPHQFSGPIVSESRFKVFFEYPLNLMINNQCGLTQVIIDDDTTVGTYTLLHNGVESDVTLDTLNLYSNGFYELSLNGDTIDEFVGFNIQNLTNEYQSILNIPWTQVPIIDAYIIPEVQSNYNPEQIIWDFGDGNFSYDDANPVHQYTEPGIYTLTCTIISSDGCIEILTSTITVFVINGCEPLIKKDKKYLYSYGIDGKLLKKQ